MGKLDKYYPHARPGRCPKHGAVKRYHRTNRCASCVGEEGAARRYGHAYTAMAVSRKKPLGTASPMMQDALHALIEKLEKEATEARRLLRELTS